MSETQVTPQRFATFREFYPFYLSEHRDRNCRRMHFAGSTFALAFIVVAIVHAQSVVVTRRAPLRLRLRLDRPLCI